MVNSGKIQIKSREDTGTWRQRGTCYVEGVPTDLFFPERENGPAVVLKQVAEARAICARCPVRAECLAYAVVNWERCGIWGAKTEKERRITRREARAAVGELTGPKVTAWLKQKKT